MPPIKIKLSLSSASLLSSSSSTPTTAEKGKAKAPSNEVSTPASYTNTTASPISEWGHGSPAPSAGPSRLSHPSLGPAFSPHTPAASTPGGTPTSSAKKPKIKAKTKSKLGRISKPKRLSQSAPVRPTAIPPHVYSGPSTPLSTPGQMAPPPFPHYPFPGTTPSPVPESRYPSGLNSPGGWDGDSVKEEMMDVDGEDGEGSPDPLSAPYGQGEGEDQGTPHSRGRTGVKWARIRKPLKELMGKIMIELRRRDEYALFSEPVNTEDFPTYLNIIGGADKMMDLSTMQNKVDNGDYRTMDQVEADLRMLVTAAQKFNPPGTVPYRSANNVLTYGLKHIERNRPLVLTPSPSPVRETTETPGRFSVDIDTEATESKMAEIELPPASRIPIEMLDFPPNSLSALAVGWNLNGGKKVYIKRDLRARERFSGKWRHVDYDGTRSLSEMDDIHQVFAPELPMKGNTVVDWKGLSREGTWWDWPGVGGAFGQPPVPFTKYPIRPGYITRELSLAAFGNVPEIQTERKMLVGRKMAENAAAGMQAVEVDEDEVFMEHLRPTAVKPKPVKGRREAGSGYTNTYDARRPGEWLRDMADGDVRGEAYRSSVRRFLEGAIKSATSGSRGDGDVSGGLDVLKDYVEKEYNNGVLSSDIEQSSKRATVALQQLGPSPSSHTPTHPKPILSQAEIRMMVEKSHARMTLRHILRPSNPLDISPFITTPGEFMLASRHEGMDGGLGWVASQLVQMTKEQREARGQKRKMVTDGGRVKGEDESAKSKKVKTEDDTSRPRAGTSPLSTAPSSPVLPVLPVDRSAPSETKPDIAKAIAIPKVAKGPGGEDERMRAVRLEILALCKFFPLTGLKPLPKALADRVLPANVRGLLSAPE